MVVVINYQTGEVSTSKGTTTEISMNREMELNTTVRPTLQEIPMSRDEIVNPIIGSFGDIDAFLDEM